MARIEIRLAVFLSILLLAGSLGACRTETPEQRVARVRQNYAVELNPFVVRQIPLGDEAAMTEGETEGEGEGEAGEAAAGEETEPAMRNDVVLDFLLSHEGQDSLPGITLDISQIGADQAEKGHWRTYIETTDLVKTGRQVTHTLEDVDYAEGDAFSVDIVVNVPEGERSEYREFAEGSAS